MTTSTQPFAPSRALQSGELTRIPWLSCLAPQDRAFVADRARATDYDGGQFVIRRDDWPDRWCGVLEGMLKVSLETSEHTAMTFSGAAPGGWFGEGTVMKGHPYRFDVQALRASTVAWLLKEDFNVLRARSIAFNRYLITLVNERLSQFMAARVSSRLDDVEQRVALNLIWLSNQILFPDVGDSIELSQQELSLIVGISRQRVNYALAALEEAGFLQVRYGHIRLRDRVALKRRAEGPPAS